MHELILGGQRSGKSHCAEQRAGAWLAVSPQSAVLLATARAGDEEMHLRISHHRLQRAERLPQRDCEVVPIDLGHLHQAIAARCDRVTLMVAGIEAPVKRAVR